MYIANKGDRISIDVTLTNVYQYTDCKFSYYGTEMHIYTMTTDDGKVAVWKTSSYLARKTGVYENGVELSEHINKGDRIRIKATVKDCTVYRDTEQTVLTRVQVVEVLHKAPTKEELEEAKRKEQMDSLKGDDALWTMPYRQYKAHYADCETIAGSYRVDDYDGAKITVIIREGRLKNSGVRFRHYSGYEFFFRDASGKRNRVCYRAISEETAYKRLLRENPDATDIEYGEIFSYGN